MHHRLSPLLAAAALSGCSAVAALDRAAAPLAVHELRAPAGIAQAPRTGRVQLTVEPPDTGGAIDTDRVLVRPAGTAVTYLPDARWSAPATEMLRAAMVEALLRTDAFAHVGRRPLAASGDVALVTTILDFGARVAEGGDTGEVEITLVARLVREEDARIISRRTFSNTVPVTDTSTPAILAGYAAASDAVLTDLVRWAIEEAA